MLSSSSPHSHISDSAAPILYRYLLTRAIPVPDEKTLEYFLYNSLKEVEEVRRAFQIGDGVVFENHPHALSDVAEEVLRPDQICVYRSDNILSSRRTMMILTSVDPDVRFQYHAEKVTASAITQIYYYMIESGFEYGLLTTGVAIVFLKVDWDEPEMLYYYLVEPGLEVSAHPNNLYVCTAVGQYLAFTLMALGSPGERRENRQEERLKAMENLKTWAEDFESTLRSIPENERSASSDASPGTRRSQRLAVRPRGGGGEQGRQYCIQKCLLGMVKGGFLDLKCPNVALHRKSCVSICLVQSLDDGMRLLGEGGARGVLFQVTLLAHGYTFVCKGTVRAFIKDLEHEAAVYERLKSIQGVYVPVFLGAIDLRSMNKIFYYDHRVYVVHMTFLSWGGCSMDAAQKVGDKNRLLKDKAIQSLRAMHQEGVIHKDVRLANMLFNPETNGVMVIDFERALLLKPPRRPLAQLVPNKRAWKSETMDVKKVTGDSSKRIRSSQSFSEDIWLARTAFLEWNTLRGI
ncbi:hypothetical protein EDB80DRAFT_756024 [Ilyonectria destructans]|nr:hypothetical protein EDB80DRAFT_756024 [Ilyonectria destructans]